MNKPTFIAKLAKEMNLSKMEASKLYDEFLKVLEESIKSEKEVALRGFGHFYVKHRPERTGVNPKTREKIKIKASKTIVFKPGKNLKNF